jgi:hypothetical protein
MDFNRYFKIPTQSPVINSKLLLLTKGLYFDFPTLRKIYPDLKEKYKVNKIRVSDRHFLSPTSTERDFIPDNGMIAYNTPLASLIMGKQKGEVVIGIIAGKKTKIEILEITKGGKENDHNS